MSVSSVDEARDLLALWAGGMAFIAGVLLAGASRTLRSIDRYETNSGLGALAASLAATALTGGLLFQSSPLVWRVLVVNRGDVEGVLVALCLWYTVLLAMAVWAVAAVVGSARYLMTAATWH